MFFCFLQYLSMHYRIVLDSAESLLKISTRVMDVKLPMGAISSFSLEVVSSLQKWQWLPTITAAWSSALHGHGLFMMCYILLYLQYRQCCEHKASVKPGVLYDTSTRHAMMILVITQQSMALLWASCKKRLQMVLEWNLKSIWDSIAIVLERDRIWSMCELGAMV